MKEKDLPIDLTKHKVYSKNAQKCVMKLLRRGHHILRIIEAGDIRVRKVAVDRHSQDAGPYRNLQQLSGEILRDP